MDPRLFLKMALPVTFGVSAITLLLPGDIAGAYTVYIMLSSLFAAFLLSLKVAYSYERELKKVFQYLAFFILFLFLANLNQFWELLYGIFGTHPYISLIVAGIAYYLLVRSCINILKVTDFTKIHKKEWLAVLFMFALGNFITANFILNYKIELTVEVLTKILFRILDNTIVIMLLPVLFLYRKQSTQDKRESITFSIVLIGIIISTIGDYVFEIVSKISYQELSSGFHTGTLLDSIYILSYLMIAVGLYVHLNYYRWTMKKIDIDKLDLTFS
ncbi:MAG: hypothetical protein OIN66_00675 [Candidatus Methanoperedens sp.]|nr:hypothetical protein [Candidatus Methanoperedens sp.]